MTPRQCFVRAILVVWGTMALVSVAFVAYGHPWLALVPLGCAAVQRFEATN